MVLQGTLTARRYVDDKRRLCYPCYQVAQVPFINRIMLVHNDSPNNVFKDMTSYHGLPHLFANRACLDALLAVRDTGRIYADNGRIFHRGGVTNIWDPLQSQVWAPNLDFTRVGIRRQAGFALPRDAGVYVTPLVKVGKPFLQLSFPFKSSNMRVIVILNHDRSSHEDGIIVLITKPMFIPHRF
ncbi:hypothetical protein TNCV_947371 [Trichonephila clavipes]|nr:hypothetical protein TNCV_947371 [Trichonephila clavipes]